MPVFFFFFSWWIGILLNAAFSPCAFTHLGVQFHSSPCILGYGTSMPTTVIAGRFSCSSSIQVKISNINNDESTVLKANIYNETWCTSLLPDARNILGTCLR